jgi:excisionase family DNA binding protein
MDTLAAKSWVSVPKAARLIEVSPQTVRRLIARGALTARQLPGTQPRIAVSDLVELVERHSQPVASGPVPVGPRKQIG